MIDLTPEQLLYGLISVFIIAGIGAFFWMKHEVNKLDLSELQRPEEP